MSATAFNFATMRPETLHLCTQTLPLVWASVPSDKHKESLPTSGIEAAVTTSPQPQMAFYRKYTEGMLRRYVAMSMEAGRVPSLLGKEMFRGRVTSYEVHSFEDVVIFIHDVETCISRLDREQQWLVRRIALQQYTQQETAKMLKMPPRTVIRRYRQTIDRLTAVFLSVGLLEPAKGLSIG